MPTQNPTITTAEFCCRAASFLTLLALLLAVLPANAAQQDIPAPPNSVNCYADTVVVLPNGNILVLAIYEFMDAKEVPAFVVINEAIEITQILLR